jgi:site-specific recombinase XerD
VSPRRLRNADLRPREFLTGEEVERLRKACADRPGRYPHRDGTMIPLAYRHGLPVSELVARAGTCSTSTRACRTCAA